MGNTHATKIPHDSGLMKERIRSRLRNDRKGAFPTFDDGCFPAQRPDYVDKREYYLKRDKNHLLKCARRIKAMATSRRRRRKRLETLSETEDEETLSFYQPLEKDTLPNLQEAAWKMADQDCEQPLRRFV